MSETNQNQENNEGDVLAESQDQTGAADNESQQASQKQKSRRILAALILSAAVVAVVLIVTGNPLIYRLFSFLIDTTTIAVVVVFAVYYLWHTHRLDRFSMRRRSSDQPDVTTSRFRKVHDSVLEKLKLGSAFFWDIVKEALKIIFSPAIRYIHAFPKNRRVRIGTYLLAGAVVILILGLEVWKITRPVYLTPRDLEDNYTLVRDAVPADGPIIVRLPDGVSKSGARRLVSFEPDIKVGYARTLSDQHIAFRLKEDLLVGDHYEIHFATNKEEGDSKTFKAVLRPQVEIFQPDAEVVMDEYSAISLFFNRAMIPLESLDREYRPDSFPISITPETEGTFTWVSPRQLQFVPEKHLTRASTYRVSIGDELYSSDGLQVPPQEYTFQVKPLSVWSRSDGVVSYKEPITVRFNQPIDLDQSTITVLKKVDDETEVPVVVRVQQASQTTYNPDTNTKEHIIDRSTILITPEEDELGRAGFWDFGSSFSYHIDHAYSLHGDLNIENDIQGTFNTQNFLLSTRVASPHSTHVRRDLFDPRGTFIYTFTEEIDLFASKVSGKGVDRLSYLVEEDCSERDSYQDPCQFVANKRILQVHFNPNLLDNDEEITVSLDAVVGLDGDMFISEPVVNTLRTVPQLQVSKLAPANGLKEASLQTLFICSNVPLAQIPDEEIGQYIESAPPIEILNWNRSRMVNPNGTAEGDILCSDTKYRTNIDYNLEEKTTYNVTLSLKDQFGGTAKESVSFTTRELLKVEEEGEGFSLIPRPAPLDFHNFHQQYSITLPDRTTYTLWTENFDEIELALCRLAPMKFIELGGKLSDISPGPTDCIERKTATIDLPDKKHESHYFQVNIADYFEDPRGHYVMTFTHPKYETTRYSGGNKTTYQKYEHIYTSVTNLSLVQKSTNRIDLNDNNTRKVYETDLLDKNGAPANLYWLVDLRTLEVVEGADIFVYQHDRHDSYEGTSRQISIADSTKTGADGIARTKVIPDVAGAHAVFGDDTAVVAMWSDELNYARRSFEVNRMYLYTDRPLYRPGHEVFIKGINRLGYDGDYEYIEGKTVDVQVIDSRGASLLETSVVLGEYGTFDVEVTLPEDAPLGTYRIHADGNGYATFDVEEYARAPFEVSVEALQEDYISGDSIEVKVDAKYFFGVALPKGQVSYTITAQDYFFDRHDDPSLNFNGGRYRCYYCGTNDTYITQGTMELRDGVALISKEVNLEDLYDEEENTRSKIFVVHAQVKDDRGKTITAQTSFIVHKANFYAASKPSKRFIEVDTQVPLQIKTVNTEGIGVQVSDLRLKVSRKGWEKYKRQEVDGEFYYSWKEVLDVVHDSTITTNGSGDSTQLITYPEPGQYSIALSGVDARGNSIYISSSVYVYGPGAAPVRPSNDRTLELSVEKNDLDVGDTAKVIIQSPYARAKALIGIERGTVMEYDMVDVQSSFFDYDFTVKDDFIPNISFTVVLLSDEPEIKFGNVNFNINRKNKSLAMTVLSNKKSYIPGEEVTLDIRTADRKGTPVSAEVSLAAVDMSVLALKGNPTRDLLSFFYGGVPHEVITSSNLKHVHTEIEIPTGTKGGGGSEDLERKKRGVFKDTAFWDASVVTDKSGYARVTFTLPDNLTKWRVESIAVTKDTKVGVHYLEFDEKKRLMTIPSVPRFTVPGDVFYVGAQVLNQSGTTQTAKISVESDTLIPLDATTVTKTLADGANELLYFKVQAPYGLETGEHVVTISAENEQLADVVDKKIPIMRNRVKEVVRLSDFSDGETAIEKLVTPTGIHEELGGVNISVHSTIGAFVDDALVYMAEFPYGCSEQLASKIDTLATIRGLVGLENIGGDFTLDTIEFRGSSYTLDEAVADGLARMYLAQNHDGGFGYYQRLQSNLGLTLHITQTLSNLRDAGYTINEERLNRAIEYIEENTKRFKGRGLTTEASAALLEFAITNTEPLIDIEPRTKHVKNGIMTIRDNLTRKTIRLISASALARAAILSNDIGWWDRRTVWKEVDRRINQDKDGVYLGLSSWSINWGMYETSIKNTALLLQATMLQKKPHREFKNMLKWLLAQRYSDGVWGSTNATHAVVEVIADYVVWRDEHHADYSLEVSLNDAVALLYNPKQAGGLAGTSTTVSFTELGLGTPHELVFSKEALRETRDTFYYDVEMEYFLDRDVIPARSEGVDVTRNFYKFSDTHRDKPVTEAELGEILVGVITFDFSKPSVLFGVEDIIPAGLEIINFDFATEDKRLLNRLAQLEAEALSELEPEVEEFMKTEEFKKMEAITVYRTEKFVPQISKSAYSRTYRPSFEELHDDRVFLFSERINPGSYKYEYYVRAQTPGVFQHMSATVSELYNPVFFGRTESRTFSVTRKDLE